MILLAVSKFVQKFVGFKKKTRLPKVHWQDTPGGNLDTPLGSIYLTQIKKKLKDNTISWGHLASSFSS